MFNMPRSQAPAPTLTHASQSISGGDDFLLGGAFTHNKYWLQILCGPPARAASLSAF